MAATGNEVVILSQLKWFKDNVVAGMVSQTIAEEASEREKQDGLLEDQIIAKIGAANIKAGTGISVSQSGSDVTIASTVKDTNTTYTLSKSGSTIKLTGSDGSSTTVTDADTKYNAASTSAAGLMSAADKSKLDGIQASADANQNAFSNVTVGDTTIAADSPTDTLTIVAGSNVSITPDATSDKLTIAATNTTYGLASTSANGLMRQLNGNTAQYMRGDGTWATPPNTTYGNMGGASSSAAGKAGLVPAPSAGASNRYLRSDGTWAVPPDTNTTYGNASTSTAGLMSAEDKKKLDGIASGANNYSLPDATTSAKGGVKVGSGLSVSGGTISTSLSNLGVSASATELNYMDGVTSNVQTQLNGKAASTHKHAAADITSGTLSSDRLPTVPVSKGGTGATSVAAARTALGVQNPITASVALTNQNLNSYNTESQCGWYYAGGGNSVTSKPSGVDAFGMFVMRTASGLYTQFLYDSNNKLWTRTYSDSTWSTWVALVRTTDTIAKASSATNATNATNATKATQDSAGQTINTTYVKSVTASGRTVTVTKGNGTTSTFQTQDTTYSNMGGASTSAAGRAGLVPAPAQGNANRYLRSDGTWQVPPDTNTTYSAATTSTAGLMSAADKSKLDGIASGANRTTVDSALSSTSTNPVQNKVINSALAGKAASSHTHPASQVTGLTANRALVSDASGHPAVSAVTSTQLGYLNGVTSAIQTQLNGKAASSHNHAASQITSGTLSADRIPTLSPTKVASDPVFIVNAAGDSRSISGKTVVKPCILVVTGTTPPQIIYDDGK